MGNTGDRAREQGMSIAKLRERLERHGLRPHRDLGQNFLVDESCADDLARRAGVREGDTVIEVGVGLGVLSLALLFFLSRQIFLLIFFF